MTEMNRLRGQRLKELRQRRGFDSQAALAAAVGVATPTVKSHENGGRGISPEMAKRYGRVLKVQPEAILYEKNFNQPSEKIDINITRTVALREVPLLDCRDMEQFRSIMSGASPMSAKTIFAPFELPAGNRIFGITQPDRSMEDGGEQSIRKGEHVLINPGLLRESGDLVAAMMPKQDQILIRKFRITEDDGSEKAFDLVGLHPDTGIVKNAHRRGVEIVGVVIGAFRSLHRSLDTAAA